MGLIKAAKAAIGSTMQDQWKEAIRCEDMGNDILMMKKTTPTGVITNKSTIIVGPGQCAIIYDNGRVLDATAEEGLYTFDSSSTPSFFAGQFGEVFKEMWQRFTYNGGSAKQQAVFFFNIKDIVSNNFGTKKPVPFQDWSHAIPNQMTNSMIPLSVKVMCFGKYTFKITNPALFMNQLAGIADIYKKERIEDQLLSEVLDAFQNILNELGNSKHKVPVLELPSYTDEIKQVLGENVFDAKMREWGMEITGITVEGVSLDDESNAKIDKYELSSNKFMQQGTLTDAYAQAVKDAANNANGAQNGFMGIGMMNMASNGIIGGATTSVFTGNNDGSTQSYNGFGDETPQEQPAQEVNVDAWTCANGHPVNGGKFCPECGSKREEKLLCKNCGKELAPNTKFCPECGTANE